MTAVNPKAKHLQAYRDRKRERGECIYGGCHVAAFKADLCVTHYGRKLDRRLVRRPDHELAQMREERASALARVNREIARRTRGSLTPEQIRNGLDVIRNFLERADPFAPSEPLRIALLAVVDRVIDDTEGRHSPTMTRRVRRGDQV